MNKSITLLRTLTLWLTCVSLAPLAARGADDEQAARISKLRSCLSVLGSTKNFVSQPRMPLINDGQLLVFPPSHGSFMVSSPSGVYRVDIPKDLGSDFDLKLKDPEHAKIAIMRNTFGEPVEGMDSDYMIGGLGYEPKPGTLKELEGVKMTAANEEILLQNEVVRRLHTVRETYEETLTPLAAAGGYQDRPEIFLGALTECEKAGNQIVLRELRIEKAKFGSAPPAVAVAVTPASSLKADPAVPGVTEVIGKDLNGNLITRPGPAYLQKFPAAGGATR